MDPKLKKLPLTDLQRRHLPSCLQTIFSKPVGDARAAAAMKFHMPKFNGTRALNFGSRKPISKIRFE